MFLLPWKVEQDWDRGIADFYVIGLADLPDDLLNLALRRMARTATYRPKPAEIIAAVGEEYTARLQARSLLRIARKQLQWQERGMTQ